MKESDIKYIAYLIKQAKENALPKPIVFLGAGASKSAGIPLAGEIAKDIREKYGKNPKIECLECKENEYPELMECLTPHERNDLLQGYIDKARINVTHIYLAQLLINDYVDYVLTVNFDNLMLRALALFNFFPPTYDMAILKDLTTTSFKQKSVVYLHGQHHGLWLLNTIEEMKKVEKVIPPIIDSIKNQRPWIVLGYSGGDPIFEHIKKITRFDNGFYWVTYKDNNPSEKVVKELLDKDNSNTSIIKGYDSDSFMLKLASELGLEQPEILRYPFTSLSKSLDNIVDIDESEHLKGVKVRLEIAKRDVQFAIKQFEKGEVVAAKKDVENNILKQRIIEIIIKGKYDEEIKEEVDILINEANVVNDRIINSLLSVLLNNYGNALYSTAKLKGNEKLYEESLEKFKRATEVDGKNALAYYNWGLAISELAKQKGDENMYEASIDKFNKATKIDSKNAILYDNWGIAISELAKLRGDEKLYEASIEKHKKATEIDGNFAPAYSNWGVALSELAELKKDEKLNEVSIEKYKKAIEIDNRYVVAYINYGAAISKLAKQMNDVGLYGESIEKYKRAIEIDAKSATAYDNWGNVILELAKLKNDEKLYEEGFEKLNKAVELGASPYNLACLYAVSGNKEKALFYLEKVLKEKKQKIDYILNDEDWNNLKDDKDFKKLIAKYK